MFKIQYIEMLLNVSQFFKVSMLNFIFMVKKLG